MQELLFSRSWIAASLIKLWDEDVDRSGGNKEEAWLKGMEEARSGPGVHRADGGRDRAGGAQLAGAVPAEGLQRAG